MNFQFVKEFLRIIQFLGQLILIHCPHHCSDGFRREPSELPLNSRWIYHPFRIMVAGKHESQFHQPTKN